MSKKNTRTNETYPVMDALAIAVAVDRAQGFIKSGAGYYDEENEVRVNDNQTNVRTTLRVMAGKVSATEVAKERIFTPTDEDRAEAARIFDHFDQILVMDKLTDSLVKPGAGGIPNTFNLTLSNIFDAGEVDVHKDVAMIASLPNSLRISTRRQEMEDFRHANRENGYIGELKARVKVTGRVMDVKHIARHSIYLVTVFTDDHKMATMFVNPTVRTANGIEAGVRLEFVGTVRNQEVNRFNGCQETMFNRVKFSV